MAFFSSSSNTGVNAVQKDVEVADPPGDSISALAFSNQADFLAVGSWDNSVSLVQPFSYSYSNSRAKSSRYEYMRLDPEGRARERRCTSTKGRC